VRNHIPKRVSECLMLRNHSIIVIIFSLIDFKKKLSRRDTDERFHLSTVKDEQKFKLGDVLVLIKFRFHATTCRVNVWNNHVFTLSPNLVS
jgi:hypothetical protein